MSYDGIALHAICGVAGHPAQGHCPSGKECRTGRVDLLAGWPLLRCEQGAWGVSRKGRGRCAARGAAVLGRNAGSRVDGRGRNGRAEGRGRDRDDLPWQRANATARRLRVVPKGCAGRRWAWIHGLGLMPAAFSRHSLPPITFAHYGQHVVGSENSMGRLARAPIGWPTHAGQICRRPYILVLLDEDGGTVLGHGRGAFANSIAPVGAARRRALRLPGLVERAVRDRGLLLVGLDSAYTYTRHDAPVCGQSHGASCSAHARPHEEGIVHNNVRMYVCMVGSVSVVHGAGVTRANTSRGSLLRTLPIRALVWHMYGPCTCKAYVIASASPSSILSLRRPVNTCTFSDVRAPYSIWGIYYTFHTFTTTHYPRSYSMSQKPDVIAFTLYLPA